MTALYNELSAYPAAWLRNLIGAGLIAPGRVDERSIRELTPDDVRGPGQRHFFAGIGVWSHALRLARVADDAPVWTASCPCQPFSAAGRRGGVTDDRHLWPVLFELVSECRPVLLLGEQVSSGDGLAWFDAVCADLEGAGYAVGAIDSCAAGVGAPHIRQRLYFAAILGVGLADTDCARPQGWRVGRDGADQRATRPSGVDGDGMADADRERCDRLGLHVPSWEPRGAVPQVAGRREARDVADAEGTGCNAGRLGGSSGRSTIKPRGHGAARDVADASSGGWGEWRLPRGVQQGYGPGPADGGRMGPVGGFWTDAEWIACTDGKARPVEPGSSPLAHGVAARVGEGGAVETRARVGELKGYGNGLVATQAATFIGCVMDELDARRAA